MQFKDTNPWPRRVFFLFMVLMAMLVYHRVFSVILIALVFLMFEVLFTRIDNNRRVIKEFFEGYLKDHK